MFKNRLLFVFISCVVLLSACLKQQDMPACAYDACAYKAPQAEIDSVKAYLDSAGITDATQHCSGLFYKIITAGTGKSPNYCDGVYVRYKGSFKNGQVFDQSTTPAGLYLNQVIRGWTNALPLLKEGGKMMLYIPPSLGYGQQAYQSIPANSMLIFEVDLTEVVPR